MDQLTLLADRLLPDKCERPSSLFDVPAIVLGDSLCMKATISRLLGLGIVIFAGLIKMPQIAKIVNNKSVVGLSKTTFLVETFGYTYNLAAHYRKSYPITTYGDFFLVLAQNYVLIMLMYRYTTGVKQGYAVVVAYICGLILLCSPYFPVEVIDLMVLGNVAVVCATRIPQAYTNYINGSTGALSPLTTWGIFLGACARIFTTLQDIEGYNILAGYMCSATLNGILAFQVVYYRVYPTKKKAKEEDKTKSS